MSVQHDGFVVAGGGIAGLATALALGRAGVHVTLFERDDIAAATDPEAAFAIERPGAPQAHHSHAFLARMVAVMRDRFPDVLDDIVQAGARTMEVAAGSDVTVLLARRTTVEWALRRAVEAEPSVAVVTGCSVTGVDGANDGRLARVKAARLSDGTSVAGSVVACTGRRGDVPAWLRPLGVDVTEVSHESNLMYTTRWYRVPAAAVTETLIVGDLGCLYYLAMPCDGDTMSVSMAPAPTDTELRACLLDEERFGRLAARLPGLDHLFSQGLMEPISAVRPMAGLLNRLRRFTDDDGEPLVLGFHAVGDAHTCTNPAYGRGCSLAMVQAVALADAVADHPTDLAAGSRAYEAVVTREVEPWFHNSVTLDAGRAAMARGDGIGDGLDLAPLFAALSTGALDDPVVAGGFVRCFNLLITPEELFADAEFVSRAMALITNAPSVPRPRARITRADLLEAAA